MNIDSLLLFLAAPANCTQTLPPDGVVVEGIQYTIECNVYYRASAGVLPTLTWTGPGFFNQISVNQTDTVVSGVGFAVQRVMDTKFFVLTTYFKQNGFGGIDTAENVPTFQSLYYSTTIFVRCEWRFSPCRASELSFRPFDDMLPPSIELALETI